MRNLINLLLMLLLAVSAESALGSRLLNVADKQSNAEQEQQTPPTSQVAVLTGTTSPIHA